MFYFTRAVLPQMYEQGRGNVVTVSAGLGRRAIAGAGPHAGSKWGLEGLSPGGRVDTDTRAHLPEAEREEILPPEVMDEAAV